VYIGTDYNYQPIYFNVAERQKRASGNTIILGATGSRKSTLIKLMILG
jgi:type IV secretory pathway VirB4 component